MKKITKFISFDNKEFDSEDDCKQYESTKSKEVSEYIKNMDSDKTTKMPFHNGCTDIIWYNIYSMIDLQMLHDYGLIEFEEHDGFCSKILNEDYIGKTICVDSNDYCIYVNGTSEEYKELVNKLF